LLLDSPNNRLLFQQQIHSCQKQATRIAPAITVLQDCQNCFHTLQFVTSHNMQTSCASIVQARECAAAVEQGLIVLGHLYAREPNPVVVWMASVVLED
jgi:hypothetical protein